VDLWEVWLTAAAAAHLGFQLTVTVLVYPVLAERGRQGHAWATVHAAHSRRITPLVVLVYGALLPPVLVAAWRLVEREAGWGGGLAVAGAVLAFATTALVAAPAHGTLGEGWSPRVGRRLVRADRVRLVGATACLVGAATAMIA
jgi:hypothetical protein